jgi:hypothetical protein
MKSESAACFGRAFLGFGLGLAGAIAIECAIRLSSRGSAPITPAMIQWMIARGALLGTPLAMLPALWYARSGARPPAVRTGVQAAALGVLLTAIVGGWVAPMAMRAYSLEQIHRARQALDDAARARPSAPLTTPESGPTRRGAAPSVRPMTPEQAVAVNRATKTWPDLLLSARTDAERAAGYRLESRRRAELTGLAAVLAFLGWTLSRLGRHALHPVMWWAATWLLTVRTPGVTPGVSLVIFAVAAIVLAMMSRAAGEPGTREPVQSF